LPTGFALAKALISPVPVVFLPLIQTLYVVPFVRSVIVADVVGAAIVCAAVCGGLAPVPMKI